MGEFMNMNIVSNNSIYNALVVEGGAMRGIFSTGVLDAFLEKEFNPFDLCIGVSAGATNIAAYLANMFQRNYNIYIDYSTRPEFIDLLRFIGGGNLLDLDWLWDITIKDIRLDLDRITDSRCKYLVGVTEVSEGNAIYLEPTKFNLENILKASSAIPLLYKSSINIEGKSVVDGGIADPIPVLEAYNRGARKILVIRSRPYDYNMPKPNKTIGMLLNKDSKLLNSIISRPNVYRNSIGFIRNPPKGTTIIEVNPPKEFKTGRLTKDISILKRDYEIGYNMGLDIVSKWKERDD